MDTLIPMSLYLSITARLLLIAEPVFQCGLEWVGAEKVKTPAEVLNRLVEVMYKKVVYIVQPDRKKLISIALLKLMSTGDQVSCLLIVPMHSVEIALICNSVHSTQHHKPMSWSIPPSPNNRTEDNLHYDMPRRPCRARMSQNVAVIPTAKHTAGREDDYSSPGALGHAHSICVKQKRLLSQCAWALLDPLM